MNDARITTEFFAELSAQVPEYVAGSFAAAVLLRPKNKGGRPRKAGGVQLPSMLVQAPPRAISARRKCMKENPYVEQEAVCA